MHLHLLKQHVEVPATGPGPEPGTTHSAPSGGQPSLDPTASNLHLPKLKLKSFSGDLAERTTFWDMFTTSVHNPQIAAIDKFTYLKSMLNGPAAKAIETLTTSAANYFKVCPSNN